MKRARRLAPSETPLSLRTLLGAFAIFLSSCETNAGMATANRLDLRDDPLATRPGQRTIVNAQWESVLKVGGSDSDTTVYYPAFLRADSEGVYLYDQAAYRVVRISREGAVKWTRGRKGKGPDEFGNVRDLELDSTGRVWVLDPENSRITVLDGSGHTSARIALRDLPYSEQVMPVSSGEAVLLTLQADRPLLRVDLSGRARTSLNFPWPSFRSLHPLASQMTAATDPRTGQFALAFRLGDGFFVFRAGAPLDYYGIFVEHTDFPTVSELAGGRTRTSGLSNPVFSAYSIALEHGRLFVLFSGRTEHRNAVVDVYDAESGDYLRSVRLPRRLSAISLGGGLLYGIYEEPYPTLEAWRPEDPSVLE